MHLIQTISLSLLLHFSVCQPLSAQQKLHPRDLEVFFGHAVQPVTINDFMVPIKELKGNYTRFGFSLYYWANQWQQTDSINYAPPATLGLALDDQHRIASKTDAAGRVDFSYDAQNRLIRKQYYDRMNVKGGFFEYRYQGAHMYEIVTNSHTPQKQDTLRHYVFDGLGRPIEITDFGKSYTSIKNYTYGANGLILSASQTTHFTDREDRHIELNYHYTFNAQGDWTELVTEGSGGRFRVVRRLE